MLDKDIDGFVTLEEARAAYETLTSVHFRKFDADGNGALSSREFAGFSAFADIMYDN